MENLSHTPKFHLEMTDTTRMTPSPSDTLLVDLDQYEEPWDHITLRINRKNGTVLVSFNGKASVNIDAITAMEFAADLVDAALRSLKGPQHRKSRREKKEEPEGQPEGQPPA